MNVNGNRRKKQDAKLSVIDQQGLLRRTEEIKSALKASTWHELETNGKFDKNDKLTFISVTTLGLGPGNRLEILYFPIPHYL